MIRLNPAQITSPHFTRTNLTAGVFIPTKTAKCTDTPDASSNYLMMRRLCVCVSRVCLCTVRVRCGSASAWFSYQDLNLFLLFSSRLSFHSSSSSLFEHEPQFFFFARTFSTHTSASAHAALNENVRPPLH